MFCQVYLVPGFCDFSKSRDDHGKLFVRVFRSNTAEGCCCIYNALGLIVWSNWIHRLASCSQDHRDYPSFTIVISRPQILETGSAGNNLTETIGPDPQVAISISMYFLCNHRVHQGKKDCLAFRRLLTTSATASNVSGGC